MGKGKKKKKGAAAWEEPVAEVVEDPPPAADQAVEDDWGFATAGGKKVSAPLYVMRHGHGKQANVGNISQKQLKCLCALFAGSCHSLVIRDDPELESCFTMFNC